jgi:hypothetical protein
VRITVNFTDIADGVAKFYKEVVNALKSAPLNARSLDAFDRTISLFFRINGTGVSQRSRKARR